MLRELKYDNVTVRTGDGYVGWPEHAPFDIIIVTAAPEQVPQPLIDQLKPGGRLIVPVGPRFTVQQLQLIEKDAAGAIHTKNVSPVMFVPMRRPYSPGGTGSAVQHKAAALVGFGLVPKHAPM